MLDPQGSLFEADYYEQNPPVRALIGWTAFDIMFCGSLQIVLVEPTSSLVFTLVILFLYILRWLHDVALVGSIVLFIVRDFTDFIDYERSPFRCRCLLRSLQSNFVARIQDLLLKLFFTNVWNERNSPLFFEDRKTCRYNFNTESCFIILRLGQIEP